MVTGASARELDSTAATGINASIETTSNIVAFTGPGLRQVGCHIANLKILRIPRSLGYQHSYWFATLATQSFAYRGIKGSNRWEGILFW